MIAQICKERVVKLSFSSKETDIGELIFEVSPTDDNQMAMKSRNIEAGISTITYLGRLRTICRERAS